MSKYVNINKPTLIEPGVQYFFHKTLQQCHKIKDEYYNLIFNISATLGIFTLIGLFLLYKYKGKKTEVEKQIQEREKQYYILGKIKQYQSAKQQKGMENITGLPDWNNEYDLIYRKLYI